MTPSQVYSQTRAQSGESSTAFLTEDILYSFIWQAETELASLTGCALSVDTSLTTAAGTREYSIPSGTIRLLRVLYDSVKLKKVDLTELDMLEGSAYGGVVNSGQPQYYYEFGDKIGLSAIPTEAKTITLYRVVQPTILDNTSTAFTIPPEYGQFLINGALAMWFSMDDNVQMATYHMRIWEDSKRKIKNEWMKKKFIDQYITVKNEDIFQQTDYGII
jgi:hypothetical protein